VPEMDKNINKGRDSFPGRRGRKTFGMESSRSYIKNGYVEFNISLKDKSFKKIKIH
jgi:hypothetical protein